MNLLDNFQIKIKELLDLCVFKPRNDWEVEFKKNYT